MDHPASPAVGIAADGQSRARASATCIVRRCWNRRPRTSTAISSAWATPSSPTRRTRLAATAATGSPVANCHLDAGRKPDAAPLWAAFVAYPAWRAKTDRVDTFDERVQQCFRYSLDGIPPAFGSIELTAIAAYAHFLAHGLPVGAESRGRGFPLLGKTGLDPNRDRGRVVYRQHCLTCHGEDGAGLPDIPPLWGFDSYNKGAGMANVDTAAAFIKANMPLGNPVLTDQEALDVAAYMNAQLRPPDPRHGLLSIFR